ECLMTREIAAELCISRKTVDTHLYRIHRKLGLRTSAELVRLAASLGMVHAGRTREQTAQDLARPGQNEQDAEQDNGGGAASAEADAGADDERRAVTPPELGS